MGISLSQMAVNKATVSFSYLGNSVNVTYKPDSINVGMTDKLDGTADSCIEAFADIILSWDFMDDSVDPPVMFPLEVERLKMASWPFLLAVRQAITRDMRPKNEAPQA